MDRTVHDARLGDPLATTRDADFPQHEENSVPPSTGMCLFVEQGSLAGGRLFILEAGRSYVIGRQESDIRLDDEKVSRRHAEIRIGTGSPACLSDLSSTNGTYLNGRKVSGTRFLKHCDLILVGNTFLRFVNDGTRPDRD